MPKRLNEAEGNWKVLLASSKGEDINELKKLLEQGACPNEYGKFFKNQRPMRPLVLAYNDIEKTRLLLGYGANPNLTEPTTGETALHSASDFCSYEVCKLLLENGADPNAQDNEGFTPLHKVAFSGAQAFREKKALATAQVLLEHGADPNLRVLAPNIQTHQTATITPLAYCSKYKEGEELCKLLLEWGADPTQKDAQGQRVIDYSRDKCTVVIRQGIHRWETKKIKEKLKKICKEEEQEL